MTHRLNKIVPDVVKTFVVPLIVIAICAPLGFVVIGPAANFVSNLLLGGIMSIYSISPVLALALIAGLWQIMVIFGIHSIFAVTAIITLATGAPTPIFAGQFPTTFAQTATVFAIWLKTKDKKLKNVALPAWISGIFGVTEPAIYGVTLPHMKQFVITCIGSALGGVYLGLTHCLTYQMAGMGIFAIPGFLNPKGNAGMTLINVAISMVISMGFSFVATMMTYKDETAQDEDILSPMNGEVHPISEIDDAAFRTSAMGDNNTSMGIAQWHNERMTNMKNYAASVGKAPTDLDAQLGYLKQELTTGYKDVYDSVKSAPSVEYSVDKWVRGFERPANMDQEVLERLPYANTVFKDHDTFAGGLRGFNSHEAKEVLSKAMKLKSKKFAGGAYGFMGGADPLGSAIIRSIFGIKNKPTVSKQNNAALMKREADKLGISVGEYYKIRYNSAEPIADQVAKLKEAKLVAKQVAADSLKNIPRAPENLTGIPASQKNVPEGVPKLTNDDLKALDEIIEARKKLERRSLNKKLEAASLNTFDAFAKRNGVLYEGKINPQQNIPEVTPKKAEVVKATIKKDSDLSGGSMGELLNSVRALDTHNDLSQMISLLKVIAEKEAVTINNNQTFNAPRTAGNIDDKRVIQAMNRVAQNRNQARLGDERLKRLMDLGSNVGDLAMDQYQMAYKISQGGNFKTV